ncbi:hypothetical protein WMF38_00075 [Sorangium sp. So ce118]
MAARHRHAAIDVLDRVGHEGVSAFHEVGARCRDRLMSLALSFVAFAAKPLESRFELKRQREAIVSSPARAP